MVTRLISAAALIAVGALGLALAQSLWPREVDPMSHEPPPIAAVDTATRSSATPESGGTLTLSAETARRAGIHVARVDAAEADSIRRLPAIVEPHGYRTVEITTLLAGTVVDMPVTLGARLPSGAVVATLRSPALTDEVRMWLTMKAERDVAANRLTRAKRLAEIGAASRQDLEVAEAADVRAATDVKTAEARLRRLGLPESTLARVSEGGSLPDTFAVVADAAGQVIARQANPGQQLDAGDSVVTLSDLSSVWVMGDLFESDLAHARVGTSVRVTVGAFPGRAWTGRLTYIEPVVARETRTVKVRVEVPNRDEALRLGMLVSIELDVTGDTGISVPGGAIQMLGEAAVVYVETSPGTFEERTVALGAQTSSGVRVLDGLLPGDAVVVAGSFALRAERERLGWAPPVPRTRRAVERPAPVVAPPAEAIPTRVVEITQAGLVPARVTIPANQAVDLVFIRRVEETCGTDVVIPDLGISRDLPIDTRVTIRLPPQQPGEVTFACGMNMLKGTVVVQRSSR
ncbi:MAG: efflux RND transporter periplasmic adaptor subunit [Vicinamibacterales bacterium]